MVDGRWGKEALGHLVDQTIIRGWKAFVAEAGRGTQQRQGTRPLGVLERHDLGDHPAHRTTDQVGGFDALAVEHPAGVCRQVIERVAVVRGQLGRKPAVACVEPHHPMAGVDEWIHQRRSPPGALGIGTRQQQHRLAVDRPEGLDVQLDRCPVTHGSRG